MKKLRLLTLSAIAVLFSLSQQTQAQLVILNDSTFTTASQMLLANELFESGEPFAEGLGYNLDNLDPMVLDSPDSIAYTTGIEAYEYSRYMLGTLTGRSGMGLNMMWSPVIIGNAAMQPASFDGMFTGGMANGYKEDDMLMFMIGSFGKNANQTPPSNVFPQFADFIKGNVNLPQTVAADFQTNFGSTRWDRSKMTKTLNLGAMGQSMWKQYFWAADMLSAFHDSLENGITATGTNSPDSVGSPNFDPNNNIFYGGDNLDGYTGQVLTAVGINKANFLINNLAYDGNTLGAVNPATYNPSAEIKYFPTKISVVETPVLTGLPPRGTTFTVVDATSQLFDQISFLLATVSFRNMMDPNNNSDAAHLAYHEAFDGNPFPANFATSGQPGPFDLMMGTSKVLFLNMMTMHFNGTAKTFVDEATLNTSGQPVMGNEITAENAAYAIQVLAKFSVEFAGTPLQGMADGALVDQANFIVSNFKDANGGFYNSYTVGTGANTAPKTLAATTAIIRGLYAAYAATNTASYLTEANAGYNYLINNFYVPSHKAFRTTFNDNQALYTPWNLATLSSALREASLQGNQANAAIIYTRVSKTIYNKMVLSEAEQTGEVGTDSDGDGIPYIAGGTKPFVFADLASYNLVPVGIEEAVNNKIEFTIFPNPASDYVALKLDIQNKANVDITIYDITGRIVIQNPGQNLGHGVQNIRIPLQGVAPGTYVIRASVANEPLAIGKFIVK
ncbi:MAG TPA: T9SS type A sorting domain-containing protein [Bacteroidetes bacterium]|nr:T9SS type A sorting domain-containing protein [Bacteroidota bacterium]